MSDGDIFSKQMHEFLGRMKLFEEDTKIWQKDTNIRLMNIESALNSPKVCGAHDSMLQMIANMKNGEKRQENMNAMQKQENIDVQKQQKVQDIGIRDLEEKDRMIEYSLSNKDLAKLIAAISALLIPATTIIIFILERVL